jgi:hypothetical protein
MFDPYRLLAKMVERLTIGCFLTLTLPREVDNQVTYFAGAATGG